MDRIDNPDGSVTLHEVGPRPATWERYLTFIPGYDPEPYGGSGEALASDIKVPIPHARRYEWQERSATESQGLGDMIRVLDAWGIHYALEQTGGFCMCLSVHTADGGTLVAGGDPTCFGYYPGNLWGEGGEATEDYDSKRPEHRAASFIVALYDRHGGPAGGTSKP